MVIYIHSLFSKRVQCKTKIATDHTWTLLVGIQIMSLDDLNGHYIL